jgi:hypothetical protein
MHYGHGVWTLFCYGPLLQKKGCAKIWSPLNGDPNFVYVIQNNNCVLQF